jgi:hypothetical protein
MKLIYVDPHGTMQSKKNIIKSDLGLVITAAYEIMALSAQGHEKNVETR